MTQEKHDFKAARDYIETHGIIDGNNCDGEDTTEFEHVVSAIEIALLLADRLQNGETSDAMMQNGWENIHPTDRALPNMVFKAMASQMIKEETNDTTKED